MCCTCCCWSSTDDDAGMTDAVFTKNDADMAGEHQYIGGRQCAHARVHTSTHPFLVSHMCNIEDIEEVPQTSKLALTHGLNKP